MAGASRKFDESRPLPSKLCRVYVAVDVLVACLLKSHQLFTLKTGHWSFCADVLACRITRQALKALRQLLSPTELNGAACTVQPDPELRPQGVCFPSQPY